MSISTNTIPIKDTNVTYQIQRKAVKNINIRIKSDGIIYVSANKSVSEKYIREILIADSGKILSVIESMKLSENKKPDTDLMRYLGKEYPVKVIHDEAEKAELVDGILMVYTIDPDNRQHIIYLIKRWKVGRCMELYQKINDEVFAKFKENEFNVPHSYVYIKEMKTRWGSCNIRDGKISMNLRLIEYPIECIYAVFYHEYAHYLHPNHSKDFHVCLNNIYPEYEKWNMILKKSTD